MKNDQNKTLCVRKGKTMVKGTIFDEQWLVNVAEKGYVLRQAKHEWENELQKNSKKLRDRIYDILKWKDENLDQNFLGCGMLYMFQIKRITRTKVVVRIWKYGADFANYYNVPFDEICSDNWKEKALDEYNKRRQDAKQKEEELKAKQEAENEAKERAEYERLKAKFETKTDTNRHDECAEWIPGMFGTTYKCSNCGYTLGSYQYLTESMQSCPGCRMKMKSKKRNIEECCL